MDKNVGIRARLVAGALTLILAIFVMLIFAVTVNNGISVNKNIERTRKIARASLVAKGKILTRNNCMAISGMVTDTADNALRCLVSTTVANDEDLVYGIYMDTSRIPRADASKADGKEIPTRRLPLDDTVSLWASTLTDLALKEFSGAQGNIIEFAAPVSRNGNIAGFIRYGVSTRSMELALKEAQASGREARDREVRALLLMGLLSLAAGFGVHRRLATRITTSIDSLVKASRQIAVGNYDVVIKPESTDEIGVLAVHFEKMRVTIKKYTDHLQVLIDEKLQQVNDILNNIDQGLFTVNLDGTVNQEYSARANEILKVSDVASCSIKELLRLDDKQESAFRTWLGLVREKHSQQRWAKLVRLAPVKEVALPAQHGTSDTAYVAISYQRMYDKNSNLAKIMVLALDETEKRHKEMQAAAERIKHENDVKAILSIGNTPVEEIAEFMDDTTARMRELRAGIGTLLDEVMRQRDTMPGSVSGGISREHIDRLFGDFHTIKGNGGSYGFDMLAHYAHEAEDRLEKLCGAAGEQCSGVLGELDGLLDKMDDSVDDIRRKIKRIFGKDEGPMVRIPEARVDTIVGLSRTIGHTTNDERVKKLAAACCMLSWKPLRIHFRKYQKLALKLARQLHKNINVVIMNDEVLYPPEALAGLDDVLIHLVRNAVDHGFEEPEMREEAGKGIGRLQFSFEVIGAMRCLTIADDGCGIDYGRVVDKSIAMNITTREAAGRLSEKEKAELLFKGGVSTARAVTEISGRGGGMQIVRHKVMELGGTLDIESKTGKGTTFIIAVPVTKETLPTAD